MNANAQAEWPYQTRVHKKRDGLMVIYGPWIVDFMHWHEGLQWRLTGKLPKRILSARAALLGDAP